MAMYRTNIQTVPAGPFHGPMVVLMRPMSAANAIRAVQVTACVPVAHGAENHLGDPALTAFRRPTDSGLATRRISCPASCRSIGPVASRPRRWSWRPNPDFCITHAPGNKLVTDRLDSELAFFDRESTPRGTLATERRRRFPTTHQGDKPCGYPKQTRRSGRRLSPHFAGYGRCLRLHDLHLFIIPMLMAASGR